MLTFKPMNRVSPLRLIAALKLVQAVLLVAFALGTLHLIRPSVTAQLREWIDSMPYDARDDVVLRVVEWFLGISRQHAQALAGATVFYAGLFAVEAGGLWARRRWAEWLTVVATGSFIPIELFELLRRPGPFKALLIGVNVAIVVYLVGQLRTVSAERPDTG